MPEHGRTFLVLVSLGEVHIRQSENVQVVGSVFCPGQVVAGNFPRGLELKPRVELPGKGETSRVELVPPIPRHSTPQISSRVANERRVGWHHGGKMRRSRRQNESASLLEPRC